MPIGIGDNDNRFAAMRPVFQRRCPGSSERTKTVMDRDGLVYLVGFVCGSTPPPATLISPTIPSKAAANRIASRIAEVAGWCACRGISGGVEWRLVDGGAG